MVLVEMSTGRLNNEEGIGITERKCEQVLTFDHCFVDCKDGFRSVGPTGRVCLAVQESPISVEKPLRAMPGLGSGRNFVSTKAQPSSKGKAILDSRQNMIIDQVSVYNKDGIHTPGPSLRTNESPVSVQKTARVNDVLETGNGLVAVDCLPSTSGKDADARESNCRQKNSSYSIDTEDTMSKSLCINQVKEGRAIVVCTSSVAPASGETGEHSVVCKNGNSHGEYMFRVSDINPQVVKECPVSEGLLSSTLEKPEKKTKQEVTTEQGNPMLHKIVSSSSPENIKVEGFTFRNNNESSLKRELHKGGLFHDNGVHLTEILEGLASLDQNGFSSNPKDNSFAEDHSKIIRNSICFSVMHEKIQSKHYKTWRSFVDDFEDICHNAMNNQQKDSMIWKAANTLLYQGKNYLEQYADKAIKFFGLHTKVEQRSSYGPDASNNGHCKVENTVHQEGECSFSKSNNELGAVLHGKFSNLSNSKSLNIFGSNDVTVLPQDERAQNVFGSTLLCTQNMVSLQEQDEYTSDTEPTFDVLEANVLADDSIVEILDCTGDEIRCNPSEQATDCSSSFGDTEHDIGDDNSECKMYDASEVESDFRNGNGAAIAAEDDMGGFKKRKKALRDQWKDYRRCIEWRCQWLELRVKELVSQASKYDRILADIQSRKLQKDEQQAMAASTARSSPQIDFTYRHRVLRRRRRKKVESTVDSSAYMFHYPLFSLYENKSLEADAVILDDDCDSVPSTDEVNDAGLDENDLTGTNYKDGDNSVEQMLVHIETLQSRILKMKNQLHKFNSRKAGKFSLSFSANPLKNALQTTSSSLADSTRIHPPVGGGLMLQEGSNLSHQRNSDIDICNSVIPCTAMPSYDESAQDEFIETPEWRMLDNDAVLDQPEKEDSSDEVTDEEAYKVHHALMEVVEKKHCNFPCKGAKHFEGKSFLGKGTSQQLTTGVTEDVGQTGGGENTSNFCLPFNIFVPKCKRKRSHSRSSLQRVEGLHGVEEPNPSSLQHHDTNEVNIENRGDSLDDGIGDNL